MDENHIPDSATLNVVFDSRGTVWIKDVELLYMPAAGVMPKAGPAASPPAAVAPFDAMEAKDHQEAWAKHLGIQVEATNAAGMKLRLIPPGEFTMGSSKEEIDWLLTRAPVVKDAEGWIKNWVKGEGPAHRVTVREPFYLGMHEVTVGQFREFVKAKNYKTEGEMRGPGEYVWDSPMYSGGESHPVVFVTPADARAFCNWLSEKDRRTYVLPTEEQWEYACRAGTTTRWSFGNDWAAAGKFAWTAENSSARHRPVGQLAANPFGLFDMHGNVTELVSTPQQAINARGGDANEAVFWTRSAWRQPVEKDVRAGRRGFRVAAVGELKPKLTLAPAVAPAPRSKP
jgi:formylglycine-generating enzyme required for sulfatase activity